MFNAVTEALLVAVREFLATENPATREHLQSAERSVRRAEFGAQLAQRMLYNDGPMRLTAAELDLLAGEEGRGGALGPWKAWMPEERVWQLTSEHHGIGGHSDVTARLVELVQIVGDV
jgi:hypothetical protein